MTRSACLIETVPIAGSEMARPVERHSISMRQPCPAYSVPPMRKSIGMKTCGRVVGPFMKAERAG